MRKYFYLLKYELKTILRDPLSLYMCSFPVILLILATTVFPLIFRSMGAANDATLRVTMLIVLLIVLTLGSFFLSFLTALLLVENKDEHTLATIAVTPVGTSGYIRFKMAYIYVMSILSTMLVLFGTKYIAGGEYAIRGVSLFDNLNAAEIISFALVNGLFVAALALFQSSFAKNKVEGFAFIKATGIVALVPILLVLGSFRDGLQYALGVLPNFWAIKGIMLELFPIESSANLSFPLYLAIGAGYNLLLLFVMYRTFLRKTEY
jgi:fluoroquinolone transport system permease protein